MHSIVSVPSGELHIIVARRAVTSCACVASDVEFVSLVLSLNPGCSFNVKLNKEKKTLKINPIIIMLNVEI